MPLRIFVIDDEESIRESFRIYLEDQGHQVLTADRPSLCDVFNGHDCQRDRPCGHALFIDYSLPEMNALEFIEMMENRGCKGMTRNKVIMSGNTDYVDMDKAFRMGCDIYQKPVKFHELDAIVRRITQNIDPGEMLAELPSC